MMPLRIARQIVQQAAPGRYTLARIHRAQVRLRRAHRAPACASCPMPANGCKNGRTCDAYERGAGLLMDIELGRHPWGTWRCLMQRAAVGESNPNRPELP